MRNLSILLILGSLVVSGFAQALIVNGKGFQQRGFRFEQNGNAVELIPMGNLSEVVVLGKTQILSVAVENKIKAQLDNSFLSGGILRGASAGFNGAVDLYLITQPNGKNAKLVMAPLGEKVSLPEDYALRSESLGFFQVKAGAIQPFKDLGGGSFLYTFPQGQDGFNNITQQFSFVGHVPDNLGSAEVEFRLRLTSSMSKAGFISLRTKEDVEVMRFYVPEAARSGQTISVVRYMPNLEVEGNVLNVVNNGVPMADFKYRILELKTTRNYSAR